MKLETKEMVQCALFVCLIVVSAQISIQLPTRVPITMQTLVIYFIALTSSRRVTLISTSLYILMGAIGLGVFSGFSGGLSSLLGPAGGFLFSFPLMAYVINVIASKESLARWSIALIVGTLLCYSVGSLYFVFVTKSSMITALTSCVIPFLPGDLLKVAVAVVISKKLKRFVYQNKKVTVNALN